MHFVAFVGAGVGAEVGEEEAEGADEGSAEGMLKGASVGQALKVPNVSELATFIHCSPHLWKEVSGEVLTCSRLVTVSRDVKSPSILASNVRVASGWRKVDSLTTTWAVLSPSVTCCKEVPGKEKVTTAPPLGRWIFNSKTTSAGESEPKLEIVISAFGT